MKNILITGANGQLGSEIQELSKKTDTCNYYFTDVDTLDLTDVDAISSFVEKNNIDYIVNCAAYTAVDKAEDDIELCYRINKDAVANLAKAAGNNIKIIHVSTDYVFDGKQTTPLKETDAVNPQSVYGKSKLDGENILLSSSSDSIIIRTAWLYSTFGNNFVKTMIRLGSERDTLNVVSDQFGTPTYARDLASAILSIIDFAESNNLFPAGVYHYSNEGECSWYDFTLKIHQYADVNCKVNPISTSEYPTRAKRPQFSVLDKTKIKDTFGIKIPQWEDSLQECVKMLSV